MALAGHGGGRGEPAPVRGPGAPVRPLPRPHPRPARPARLPGRGPPDGARSARPRDDLAAAHRPGPADRLPVLGRAGVLLRPVRRPGRGLLRLQPAAAPALSGARDPGPGPRLLRPGAGPRGLCPDAPPRGRLSRPPGRRGRRAGPRDRRRPCAAPAFALALGAAAPALSTPSPSPTSGPRRCWTASISTWRPAPIVALIGPSGAGKTSLLHLLLGLAPLTAGEVWSATWRCRRSAGSPVPSPGPARRRFVVPGSLGDNSPWRAAAPRPTRSRPSPAGRAGRRDRTPQRRPAAHRRTRRRAVGRRAAPDRPGPRPAEARPDPPAGRADGQPRRGVGSRPAADHRPRGARAAPP